MNISNQRSMKVIYSHSFYPVYSSDPAGDAGRIPMEKNNNG